MFKKPKRAFRQREQSPDSDDASESSEEDTARCGVLEEARELQRLRKRQRGVKAEDLAVGKTYQKEVKGPTDPLKLQTGGFVDLKTLKKEIASGDLEEIGTSFAAETNRRDEDAEMLKYVEEEMRARKGVKSEEEESQTMAKDPTDSLYELPDNIKAIVSKTKRTEDMLSNQMLSGIPEVDLGIEVKIKNIEATEDAKSQLLLEKKKKDIGMVEFIPTNMAVNFVQHNRFNIEDSNAPAVKKVKAAPKPEPLRVGDADRPRTLADSKPRSAPSGDKATDDFHYERFKKQIRRY